MSQILWLSDTYLPYFATSDMQQKQMWFGATKLGVSDRYKPLLFAQAKLQISLYQWTNELMNYTISGFRILVKHTHLLYR